ncbi:helix-turn-helix transcriptional regulator [Mucilaginibacter sp. KACC 22773]|uniref:helix-turn-helix domain-containing protein n=1 Tax=Mucilaginibacter sp. KACC 22773 TaxID=3025671 RepID=UPI002366FC0B|nr:helix-turn-helix transcriptional regulator [Mucilaginibacter sp. KACC 22773]WDF77222.1 helix-turn-helix transcriptional regulator [Mucilaginibacter sp. KACC 22773]
MSKEVNVRDFEQDGFIVYEVGEETDTVRAYSRKAFYKICMMTGQNKIEYADRGILTKGTTLFFGTPHIPYSWETISENQTGFCCLFTESFLKLNNRSESLQQSPLFKVGGSPIFFIEKEARKFLSEMFHQMIGEYRNEYVFKDDLMRNYINLIIHEALKMNPPDTYFQVKDASSRITGLFLDLLERQFPIESPRSPLVLKTPHDYADALSVHVNHLNRSVKEITGKSTSRNIAERIVSEGKELLRRTDWSMSDIGFALGFEYTSYFNSYFKRYTGTIPKFFRGKVVPQL